MNTIKSKKLFICTADTRTETIDKYGNLIYNNNFKEFPYYKLLPKKTLITQEELELDNGLFIKIKTNISKSTTNYKIIQILEDREKKIGYQFDSWLIGNAESFEEPIFLGGIKNKNAKYMKIEGGRLIKIPYNINLEFTDLHNKTIFFTKLEKE